MAINEAGQHRLVGKVDDLGAGRGLEAGFDGCDALVVDEDGDVVAGSRGHPVEQSPGVNNDILGRNGGGEQGHRERREATDK